MRHYMVVGHQTLTGEHLRAEVTRRLAEGPCDFHLVVPVHHPPGAWSQGQVEQAARDRLAEALVVFGDLGATADGVIGDISPATAALDALRQAEADGHPIDEIILTTLPRGVSKWLALDPESRLRERTAVPITHVVAARS